MMIRARYFEQDMPIRDDGWWASVMAEDESRFFVQNARNQKTEETRKPSNNWERALRLFHLDEIIFLKVIGHNHGGVLVEGYGLNGFVPCSHLMDLSFRSFDERDANLAPYLGQTLQLKIIECVPEEGRLVLSERAARTEAGKRPELFNSIQKGQHLTGEVTNITQFGVFVDLGGVEGLIHISELSWGRVTHPRQVCKVGQQLEVQVMDVSPERCRIALSLKQLLPNPWERAQEIYPVDGVFPAVVTTLVPYGAFARLEEGLEGLIHSSEIPLPPQQTVKDILSPGQNIQVKILQVDASRQRLGLSMKLE